MSAPEVRLGFFKLNVADIEAALAFWRDAFGFTVTMTFDEADFVEHVLALPGQEQGPNLMLVQMKNGGDLTVGNGHGPVGFTTSEIDALHARAVAAGARPLGDIFAVDKIRLAMLLSPDGHQIELVQLPA